MDDVLFSIENLTSMTNNLDLQKKYIKENHWDISVVKERQTGLEPATSTLARWRTTNCTTIACVIVVPQNNIYYTL